MPAGEEIEAEVLPKKAILEGVGITVGGLVLNVMR
jgi:hypothetical protein